MYLLRVFNYLVTRNEDEAYVSVCLTGRFGWKEKERPTEVRGRQAPCHHVTDRRSPCRRTVRAGKGNDVGARHLAAFRRRSAPGQVRVHMDPQPTRPRRYINRVVLLDARDLLSFLLPPPPNTPHPGFSLTPRCGAPDRLQCSSHFTPPRRFPSVTKLRVAHAAPRASEKFSAPALLLARISDFPSRPGSVQRRPRLHHN